MKTETKVAIAGQEIVITTENRPGRFGNHFYCRNNTGEPRTTLRGYRTAGQAMDAEVAELTRMLS